MDKGKKITSFDDAERFFTGILTDASNSNLQVGTTEVLQGTELFRSVVQRLENVGFAQSKGNLFEYIEALKFNRNAANSGIDVRAVVTESVGRPHDLADIEIVNSHGHVEQSVQAKFMKTHNSNGVDNSAASTVSAQAGGQDGQWGKYNKMDRLIRMEENYDGKGNSLLDESRKIANQRAEIDGGLHSDEYRDTANNLTDKLIHKKTGVSSGGTTHEEVEAAHKNPGEYVRNIEKQQMKEEVFGGAARGAAFGAGLSGITAAVSNAVDLIKGEKNFEEAVGDIGKKTAKGAAYGGATGGLAGYIRVKAEKNKNAFLSKGFNATMAAGALIDVGVLIIYWMKGEITIQELVEGVVGIAVRTAVATGIYTVFGGSPLLVLLISRMICNYMYNHTIAIIKNAKLNAEKYRKMTALLTEIDKQIKTEKAATDLQLREYVDTHKALLGNFIIEMDEPLMTYEDCEVRVARLRAFADRMSIQLQYESREEFDEAMEHGKPLVLR